jgi:hypothetical protein
VCQFQIVSTEGFTPYGCAKTVSKFQVLTPKRVVLQRELGHYWLGYWS